MGWEAIVWGFFARPFFLVFFRTEGGHLGDVWAIISSRLDRKN